MDILLIKMSALGDVIHALPVIPSLRRAFPGANIHWLVEETAAPLLHCHPGVNRVLVSHRGKWGRHLRDPRRWLNILLEMWALVRQLRLVHYDLAIDFQGLLKSGVWISLARAKRKVGYDRSRERSHFFLTERVPPVDPDIHAVERYLMLVKSIVGEATEVNFGLSQSHEDRNHLWKMFRSEGLDPSRPYAVLVPAARWETKRWPEESFARLADWLAMELGLQVAITGVEADRPLVARIVNEMGQPSLDLSGRTDVLGLMSLLKGAHVVVSTDSGPMHLAVAVGTPVVAVFGPTAPCRTGPYGEGHRVVRGRVECSPCFRRSCTAMTCMKAIDFHEVAGAVEDVLLGRVIKDEAKAKAEAEAQKAEVERATEAESV
jgi:heptosyltransferase I